MRFIFAYIFLHWAKRRVEVCIFAFRAPNTNLTVVVLYQILAKCPPKKIVVRVSSYAVGCFGWAAEVVVEGD